MNASGQLKNHRKDRKGILVRGMFLTGGVTTPAIVGKPLVLAKHVAPVQVRAAFSVTHRVPVIRATTR